MFLSPGSRAKTVWNGKRAFNAAAASGAVTMYPAINQAAGPWVCIDPFGNPIGISGTKTQGLQESLNFALTNGFPFRCYGTGIGTTGGAGAVISCTAPVVLPAIQIGDIRFYDVTINFGAAIGANSGFVFDSAEILVFELNGQIVSQGTGAAVEINPTTKVFLDQFIGFTQNIISIKAVACNGNSSTAIALKFTPAAGSVSENIIRLGEFAGGSSSVNAGYGIQVASPSTSSLGFEDNLIEVGSVHGFGGSSANGTIQIGTSSANQAKLRGSVWRIGAIRPVNGATGFDTFGQGDIVDIGSLTNQEGSVITGLNFRGGANNNLFSVGFPSGLSGALAADAGSNNIVWSGGKFYGNLSTQAGRSDQGYSYLTPSSTGFSITLNASNYTTIIDSSAIVPAATITLSSSPIDGSINKVVTGQSITALTVSPSAGQSVKGAPTSLAVGGRFEATYRAANTTWYI